MKKKLAIVATLALLSGITTTHLKAIIETITVHVDNTQCPFCIQSIAKRILELKGVKKVSFVGRSLHMIMSDNNTFNTSILKKIIEKDTHYTIKNVKITATGSIDKKGKFYVFGIDNSPEKIYLGDLGAIEKEQPDKSKNKSKSAQQRDKKRQRGSQIVDSGKRFWNKTTGIIGSWFAGITPTREELERLYQKEKSVRFAGTIHFHTDGVLWISGRGAIIKEIKTKP